VDFLHTATVAVLEKGRLNMGELWDLIKRLLWWAVREVLPYALDLVGKG
jgi:hypothetical protein